MFGVVGRCPHTSASFGLDVSGYINSFMWKGESFGHLCKSLLVSVFEETIVFAVRFRPFYGFEGLML